MTGYGGGSTNGNGNNAVQTFAWVSYVTANFFAPPDSWAIQDIHAISHEIAEWGADGTHHPEDETFLPWFMRTNPNTILPADAVGLVVRRPLHVHGLAGPLPGLPGPGHRLLSRASIPFE